VNASAGREEELTLQRAAVRKRVLNATKAAGIKFLNACNENNVDAFTTLRNARAQEAGKLPPPDRVRNVDDPKATVIQREEQSDGAKK